MNRYLKPIIATFSAMLLAASAQASVIYEDFSGLGKKASPDNITWNFDSANSWASLNFQLAGFLSLDGYNNRGYTDIFHLLVNGAEVFTGSFNLGGGGTNKVLSNPNGGTAVTTTFGATDDVHNSKQVTWQGGVTQIVLPIELMMGANQIKFQYSGVAQGWKDESWGVNLATITPLSLPEPSTILLLVLGLGSVIVLRRRSV